MKTRTVKQLWYNGEWVTPKDLDKEDKIFLVSKNPEYKILFKREELEGLTCVVCGQEYEELTGYENGTCSTACYDWLLKEIELQEDTAIDRLEAGITEAETDYDN